MSCLLFVAFELFHGNHTSALQQASLGLKMIMERMKDSRNTKSPTRRLDDLFSSIDEALIQKFIRLDLSSMAFVDENVIKAHLEDTSPEMFENLHIMPPVFVDLAEAQRYWELSMRPIMNFMTLATSKLFARVNLVGIFHGHEIAARVQISECIERSLTHRASRLGIYSPRKPTRNKFAPTHPHWRRKLETHPIDSQICCGGKGRKCLYRPHQPTPVTSNESSFATSS